MNFRRILAGMLRTVRYLFRRTFYLAAMSTECVACAVRPSSWVAPVRARFSRQVLFGGVEAIPFTIFVAALIGIVATLNSFKWLEYTGKLDSLGPAVAILVIREAAPFFACVIIICASASAITTELATMRVTGEIDLIEGQGINLLHYLVMPRAVGLAVAGLGLAAVFVTFAFLSAALVILILGRIPPGPFFESIVRSLDLADILNFIGRSAVPSFLIAGICCYEGLSVVGPVTVVPQAVTRAMLRSVAVTLIISAAFALLTYL
ncbi:MAG: ABC transporter permease [Verrucomicrobiales bacterium]|nr:ABC transporter permease [Verrucomicrobiales bacterium]